MELRGSTAVVIGGAQRIGRDIALGLAREKANVVIGYRRSADAAHDTACELRKHGVNAAHFRVDAAEGDEVDALAGETLLTFGRIDLLVVTAGVFRRTRFQTLGEQDWDDMMRNNLDVFLVPALRIGSRMKATAGGCIIALSDIAALRTWPEYAPYSIAKAGVAALSRSLARQFAPHVRVNAIAPGPILFPTDGDDAAYRREIARTALKRPGGAESIVEAVLFLARNEFVTGILLPVDGGRMLATA